MDIAVPSRFACLKIEDDDTRPPTKPQTNGQKKKEKPNVKKTLSKLEPVKKNKQPADKKGKKKVVSEKQWEEWKERDSELVDGNFEQDLKNAILLSKLDYEEKKEVYSQAEKEANDKKKSVQNKKKKNKSMSLDQFLNKQDNNNISASSENAVVHPADNKKFFERVQLEVKEELTKEKIMEKCKARQVNIEEIITIAQYQEKLKFLQNQNMKLEKELEEARNEVKLVKERNKKLCGILGYGEMKDKADVLIEVERLNTVKDELTEEVRRLHELLEQERSKVTASSVDSHSNKHNKEKKNKKHAT